MPPRAAQTRDLGLTKSWSDQLGAQLPHNCATEEEREVKTLTGASVSIFTELAA